MPTQTIIDAPRNENGKADFLKKVEFTNDIMPVLTAFEDENCIVSSSSQYDATNYMAWKAFRHHTNDTQGWLTVNGTSTGWLKIEFKNHYPKITAFSITSRNSTDSNTHAPCDFVIEGSNDDVNWTLLGDYSDNLNWLQNEKRYFALTYFDSFKYYRITINKNSGGAAYSGFGALELFETTNDFMPMIAKVDISTSNPLLINTGIGKSTVGKSNQLSIISEEQTIENLYNNAISYLGYIKNSENRFEPFVTTARPIYANNLQRHSDTNSVPNMISFTTSKQFKSGYVVSESSHYVPQGGNYPAYLAFNGIWNNKWSNIKLKITNRRTRKSRVLLLEEFKKEFAAELQQAIRHYSEHEKQKEFLPPIMTRNKDYTSDFYFSLQYNFNNYACIHTNWFIERFI